MTTLAEAVDHWADEPDNDDHVIELVARHGVYDDRQMDAHDVDVDGETTRIHIVGDLDADALEAVEQFVRDYRPEFKQCYANAAELARYDDRFDYVEGVTANDETGNVHDHAWNVVGDAIVDVTRDSDERYGVRVPNRVLREALPALEEANRWNVLDNSALSEELNPPYDRY